MNLINIVDLTPSDIRTIWRLASETPQTMHGTVGWSFEGNGIRTRTTFIQAFRDLGLSYTELPNLLKTGKRTCDLASYLDPFYAMYEALRRRHTRARLGIKTCYVIQGRCPQRLGCGSPPI